MTIESTATGRIKKKKNAERHEQSFNYEGVFRTYSTLAGTEKHNKLEMNLQSLQINPSGFNVLAETRNLFTDSAGRWEGQKGKKKEGKRRIKKALLVFS